MVNEIEVPMPRYTIKWLGTRALCVIVMALVMALLAVGVDSLAAGRLDRELISAANCNYVTGATTYCFVVVAISCLSLMLVELAFRRDIAPVQYVLIGCALCLFNMLLLALAEHMRFDAAYAIVTVMTIGLISCFVRGMMKSLRPALVAAAILAVEYALIFFLVRIGAMALLIGSLSLFILIAVAMYFSVKLKIVDDELVLK